MTSAAGHGPRTAAEAAIALAPTTSWMLITGRWEYPRPLLHDLPAEQLIDFWADDHAGDLGSGALLGHLQAG